MNTRKCYSCNEIKTNFYVNGNTGKIAKYCRDCCVKFTPSERKRNEFRNVLNELTSSKAIMNTISSDEE